MVLEVRRRLIPITVRSDWEQLEYDHLVWKHDGTPHAFPDTVPEHYARGLLTTYLDGHKVPLHLFIEALHMVGLTLQAVEQAIAKAEGT